MASTIGSRIRKIRKAAGLSLAELGQRTGIDRTQLSKMENDIFDLPAIHRVRRIAKALDVMPDDIVLGHAAAFREQQRITAAAMKKAAADMAGEV